MSESTEGRAGAAGGKGPGVRLLVAFASRHGGTAELADVVAEGVRERLGDGVKVTVLPAGDVTDVDAYDAVVIGSALYFGHWLEEARQLALRCAIPLWDLPVWIFSSGPLGVRPRPPEQFLDIDEIVRLTRPVEHHLFGGRLDPTMLDFGERAVVFALHAPTGDFRDLAAAREWGKGIARVLAGEPVRP